MTEENDLMAKIEGLTGKARKTVMRKWRSLVMRELKRMAKKELKASKFKTLKPKGRLFGIKPERRGDGLRMFGTKPNVGLLYGFSAPVDERVRTRKAYTIRTEHGWRRTHLRQRYADSLGTDLDAANVSYYGTRARPKRAFFGIRKNGKTLAYSLVDDRLSLPVYSDEATVDWLMEHKRQEIDALVQTCGELAIQSVLGS